MALSMDLNAQNRKKAEISLGGGSFYAGGDGVSFGAFALGICSGYIGAELNGAIVEGGIILGGNLSIGPFALRGLIPYATGGIWTTTLGGFGFNVGGGIRFKLTEAFALRTEYRRYIFNGSDWGINALIGAATLFF